MTEKNNTERRKIGSVFVDTGTLVVADPCRMVDEEDWQKGNKWYDLALATGHEGRELGKGDAVSVVTGWGDGWYDVVATYVDCGNHKRIGKIEIVFISDEEEDDEAEEEEAAA